ETGKDSTDTGGENQECNVPSDCATKLGTIGSCEEPDCQSGKCVRKNKPKDTSCENGDSCTENDSCDGAGHCIAGTFVCDCQKNEDCALLDSACTVGVCNVLTSTCEAQSTNEGGDCDDGNECTTSDTCKSGTCVGTPQFGLVCGSGESESCDFWGTCVKWTPLELSVKPFEDATPCATQVDCPSAGFQCVDGLCRCLDAKLGCTCGTQLITCDLGQNCLERTDPKNPTEKLYSCVAHRYTIERVCRIADPAGDIVYAVTLVSRGGLDSGDSLYDAHVRLIEGGNITSSQTLFTQKPLPYASVQLVCDGPLIALSASGEIHVTELYVRGPSGSWKLDKGLMEAVTSQDVNTVDPRRITGVYSTIDPAGKRVFWIGGEYRFVQADGTGYGDHAIRCVEDTAAVSGYSCKFVKVQGIEPGVSYHVETLPDGLRPPYDGTRISTMAYYFAGHWDGAVERLVAGTMVRYSEYLSSVTPPYSGEVSFAHWILGGLQKGTLTLLAPDGCSGASGFMCEVSNTEVGFNRGIRDLSGRGDKRIALGGPPQFWFEDSDALPKPDTDPVNSGRIFLFDGSKWSERVYPASQRLTDPGAIAETPYEFIYDQARFLTDSLVLIAGHYRACLGVNCFETSGENAAQVSIRPFITTYDLSSDTFGPMIPIGAGTLRDCCMGDSCQTTPHCLQDLSAAVYEGETFHSMSIREHPAGLEIYLALNPAPPDLKDFFELEDTTPTIFRFIATKKP
ncbi:MAG: hypothetical protein KC609_25770, partial [Myxococcales bacterium]|nr:hypothetical protein [Myxococcales bacterium]